MSKLYPSVSSVRMPNQHCFTLCLYAQLCELSMRVRHLSLGMCACVCARVWALLANYLKIRVKQRFYAQGFSINHFGRCILSISCPSLFSFCFVLGLTTFLWIPPNTHTHQLKTVSLELKLDRKFLELRTLEVL